MPENPVPEPENESQNEAQPAKLSRRSLLTLSAIAGAAIALPALPSRADFPYSDIRTLRYLEEIAALQADFFTKITMSSPADALSERERNIFNLLAQQDGEVARWSRAARRRYNMGAATTFYTPNLSTSRPLPSYQFGLGTFATREALFSHAIDIKETAVGAFHGAVGGADSPKMIQAFASIAGVQGRHLAILQELAEQEPLIDFENALSRSAVARKFEQYGFNREVLT